MNWFWLLCSHFFLLSIFYSIFFKKIYCGILCCFVFHTIFCFFASFSQYWIKSFTFFFIFLKKIHSNWHLCAFSAFSEVQFIALSMGFKLLFGVTAIWDFDYNSWFQIAILRSVVFNGKARQRSIKALFCDLFRIRF